MFELVSTKNIKLTPKLAAGLLELNTYEGQRTIRQSRVDFLIQKHEEGTIKVANIAVAGLNGSEYLTNGQHCCMAAIQGDFTLPAVIERYRVASITQLGQLYAQFDNPRSVRTQPEIFKPLLLDTKLHDLSSKVVRAAAAALSFLEEKCELNKRFISAERKALLLKGQEKDILLLAEITKNANDTSGFLTRAAVYAAILVTIRKDRREARDFWTLVRDGEMLLKESPARLLREFLLKTQMRSGPQSAIFRETYSRCIEAWNCYRHHTPGDLRYFINRPLPAAV